VTRLPQRPAAHRAINDQRHDQQQQQQYGTPGFHDLLIAVVADESEKEWQLLELTGYYVPRPERAKTNQPRVEQFGSSASDCAALGPRNKTPPSPERAEQKMSTND
jgi:hypothetical protein